MFVHIQLNSRLVAGPKAGRKQARGRATINRLTNLQIRNAIGPARLQDGGGLSLRVRKSGTKAWVFTYRLGGQRPEIGLGAWPAVSLAWARKKAEQARAWLAATPKLDPRMEWEKLAKLEQENNNSVSFGEFAEAFISDRARGWENRDHKRQWRGSLRRHAKSIWVKPINEVTSSDILDCLKPIWYEIPTTAKRVLGRMELIFDAARADGCVNGMNPATWRGNLQSSLPKVKRQERHHAAIELDDVQEFWVWLTGNQAMSARCLQFLLLTATRSGEARGARWAEIDLENEVWTIPAERTKNGEAHRVPLSKVAVEIVASLRDLPGSVVFPSPTSFGVLSDKALQKLCRNSRFLSGDNQPITPHGCRAAFRTWAEHHADEDTAERALGHRRSKLVRSYARGDKLEQRRELMQLWAIFVSSVN